MREDGETEELFRKFQAILNKLTAQKFQNLAEQALQLKIDSEERLKGCIDKIFTKVHESGRGKREREREKVVCTTYRQWSWWWGDDR